MSLFGFETKHRQLSALSKGRGRSALFHTEQMTPEHRPSHTQQQSRAAAASVLCHREKINNNRNNNNKNLKL
jgi:predicted aconitase